MSSGARGPRSPLNLQIYDEACTWFVEMRSGDADDETRRRFDSWARKSPEHLRAYLEASEIWDDASRVSPDRTGSQETLLEQVKDGAEVVPLAAAALHHEFGSTRTYLRPRVRRAGLPKIAAIAATLVVGVGGWLWYQSHRSLIYETGTGEQRVVTLADGSRIELNADTQLKVRYSVKERDIDLLEGQALFSVAKNKERPFIVRSGDVLVRAVGTQFDVDQRADGTRITVVEGRVLVRTAQKLIAQSISLRKFPSAPEVFLDAGQQVIASRNHPLQPSRANINAVTSWTRGTLVFEGSRLAEVVKQFNRNNPRQLLIKNPELENMRISGVYSSTDPSLLIEFLREQPGVQVDQSGSSITISARGQQK